MTIEKIEDDFHIEAYPTRPGDVGFAFIGGHDWKPGEERLAAEALLREAEAHLTRARGVHTYIQLRWATHYRCSHCGATSDKEADLVGCCEVTLP